MQTPYSTPNTSLGAVATLTAASVSGNSADLVNGMNRGVTVGVNVSAISGTSASLTVTIQGKDPASGNYYTVLAGSAITATGYSTLVVYPGAAVTANESASLPLPQNFRVSYAIAGTSPSVTATISAVLQV